MNEEESNQEKIEAPPEQGETLWLLTVGPLIWSLHFLLSYITAAIWCAKVAGRTGSLDGARFAIVIYSLIALTGIALTGWKGFRQFRLGEATTPHDSDTAADRHRFLGFATILLCGLSFVATLYVTLAALMLRNCL